MDKSSCCAANAEALCGFRSLASFPRQRYPGILGQGFAYRQLYLNPGVIKGLPVKGLPAGGAAGQDHRWYRLQLFLQP